MSEDENGMSRLLRPVWWVGLLVGVVFVIYGLMVLSLRPTSVLSLAILAGVSFILGGIEQFVLAGRVSEWKWLFYIGGALAIVAGVVAMVWPDVTLFVVAVFVAWYLVIGGVFTVIGALVGHKHDFWWAAIVLGILQFILGLWAIGSPGREVLLLVNLVGFYLVIAGFAEVLLSLAIRKVSKEADALASAR